MQRTTNYLALLMLILIAAAAACGGGGEGETADAGNADAGNADAGEPGASCGGFVGAECERGQYCDFAGNQCGGSVGVGECRVIPSDCGASMPVCACDGQVYETECLAAQAGHDVSVMTQCAPPLDMFQCGYRFCAAITQYCLHVVSDVGGVPDDYECVDVPAACGGSPDCACLQGENCGEFCAVDKGELFLTCPGG